MTDVQETKPRKQLVRPKEATDLQLQTRAIRRVATALDTLNETGKRAVLAFVNVKVNGAPAT